jgi:glycosyltransferase involved in cell wall biosynthesis
LRVLVMALYRSAFRHVPVVFFQNPDDQALFLASGLARACQARLLPGSGVDCVHFAPTERPAEQDAPLRFLFVGRLLAQKGLRELVDAIRIVKNVHPETRFAFLGFLGTANRSAIAPAELDGWVAEGLVEYLGASDDVRPHLAKADAVMLPSWREGLPRSLLEAAAMGKPLIASNVPGCREIVQDGVNGFLHEVRSAQSIAQAVFRFIALPPAERSAFGSASRRRAVEDFAEQRVIDAYLQALAIIAPLPSHSSEAESR